jgi:pimeloyl-ACP methyl ester carboxylesterase
LSDEVAQYLTTHGTNWEADGSLIWKFDNYVRALPPYGHHVEDSVELFSQIACPLLMFWGLDSFLPVPDGDPRWLAIRNSKMVRVADAGHWVHHDQLKLFLNETIRFLE